MKTFISTFLLVSTCLLSTHAAADANESRMVRRTKHQHLIARESSKTIPVGRGFEIKLPEAAMHSEDEDQEKDSNNNKRANGPWRPQLRGHAAHADHTPKFMQTCEQYRNSFNKAADETGLPATLLMSISFFNTGCQDHPFSEQRIARDGLQFGIMQLPADIAFVFCDPKNPPIPGAVGDCRVPGGSPPVWNSPAMTKYLGFFRSPEANIRAMAFQIAALRNSFRAVNVPKPTLAVLDLLYHINGWRWGVSGAELGSEYGVYVTKPGVDIGADILDLYHGGLYDNAGHRRGHWHV